MYLAWSIGERPPKQCNESQSHCMVLACLRSSSYKELLELRKVGYYLRVSNSGIHLFWNVLENIE